MKYIDLTMWLDDKTEVFPGEEGPIINSVREIGKDEYNMHRISIPTHIGTHIDYPNHMIKDGKTSEYFDVNDFIGRGCFIEYDNYDKSKILDNSIVVLSTNHDNSNMMKNIKYLDENIANDFISKNVKVLCIDTPTPDKSPFNVHKLLLSHDILIVENVNLKNCSLEGKNFNVFISPLKVYGMDGVPCNVILEIEE